MHTINAFIVSFSTECYKSDIWWDEILNRFDYECGILINKNIITSWLYDEYRKTSNISRTLVGNKIVDNSDVVGASPVGDAPTTSSFST